MINYALWDVGIAFLNRNKNSKLTYRRIRKNQDRQCLELAHLISHDVDKPCNIKEIMAVETLLVEYQILIISYESDFEFIYVGPDKEKRIVLLHHKNHYDFIKSLPAFFNRN